MITITIKQKQNEYELHHKNESIFVKKQYQYNINKI